MISFFRKFRQQLIGQNKLIKYLPYAFGEIALVMIGILLALQVNGWNEERQDRKKEKAFLQALHQESLKNRIQLDTVRFYHRKALENCRKIISMFPIDTREDSLDSIGTFLSNTLYTWTFNPSQGAIKAIVNTSSFDIIRNEELREILISFSDQAGDAQEDELKASNVVDQFVDPYYSKHFDFDMDLSDPRNNLEALESLEFEYIIKLRENYLRELFKPDSEMEKLTRNLDRLIELTAGSGP